MIENGENSKTSLFLRELSKLFIYLFILFIYYLFILPIGPSTLPLGESREHAPAVEGLMNGFVFV